MNNVDPDGHFAFLAPLLIGASIGAVSSAASYLWQVHTGDSDFSWGSFTAVTATGAIVGGLSGMVFGYSIPLTGIRYAGAISKVGFSTRMLRAATIINAVKKTAVNTLVKEATKRKNRRLPSKLKRWTSKKNLHY